MAARYIRHNQYSFSKLAKRSQARLSQSFSTTADRIRVALGADQVNCATIGDEHRIARDASNREREQQAELHYRIEAILTIIVFLVVDGLAVVIVAVVTGFFLRKSVKRQESVLQENDYKIAAIG
jgi:hypothetical protein